MKIGIIADPLDFQYAGIKTYTLSMIEALREYGEGHELYVARRDSSNMNTAHYYTEKAFPCPAFFPPYRIYRNCFQIPQWFRKVGVDIVIEPAHFGPFNLPESIKRLTVIHDLTPIKHPEWHTLRNSMAHRLMLKRVLRKSDHILANSKHTLKDIRAYMPECSDKSSYIYPGRDDFFYHNEGPARLPFYLNAPYLLISGTMEPRKNHKELLEAFEILKHRTGKNIKLVIVGREGWRNSSLMKMLKKHLFHEDIILTGYIGREDLRILYSRAELFVFPSLYEGFGLPVLEAMSCGAACLLSEASSLPEVGGKAAHYYKPGNAEMLCNKLIELLDNPEELEAMRKKSLLQAVKFSKEEYGKVLINLIDDIAGGK